MHNQCSKPSRCSLPCASSFVYLPRTPINDSVWESGAPLSFTFLTAERSLLIDDLPPTSICREALAMWTVDNSRVLRTMTII